MAPATYASDVAGTTKLTSCEEGNGHQADAEPQPRNRKRARDHAQDVAQA
jgi:hypothetical protein